MIFIQFITVQTHHTSSNESVLEFITHLMIDNIRIQCQDDIQKFILQ